MLKHIFFALLLLPVASCHVSAQSLEDAVQAVSRNNLRLKALEADAGATVLDRKAENIIEGPSIEYSPFYDNGKTGVASSELIVSQSFDFPTVYRQRREARGREAQVLQQQWEATRRDVLLEVRLLGLDIIRANQLIDMHRQRLAQCDTTLLLLERRLSAGDATALEVNKGRLTRMTVQQQLAEAEGERLSFLAQLTSLNGGEQLDITDRDFPHYLLESDFDTFAETALRANADIRVAEAALQVADYGVSMSRRSWLPQLSVGYRRNTDGGNRLNGFLVGAAFPLYSTASKVRAARAREAAARLEVQVVRQEASDELRGQYNELLRLHSVLDHTDTALLQETLVLLRRALEYGQITALEYYLEAADIYDKLLAHVDLHHRYVRLYAEAHKEV